MIFVTVGSAPHDFTRLVKAADDIAGGTGIPMVIQRGFSVYTPRHAKYFDFVPYDDALELYRTADIIISHASAGPIMYARKSNKPLIVFPRSGDRHEHVDNHQLETAKAVEGSSPMLEVVYDAAGLPAAIERARARAASAEKYKEIRHLRSLVAAIAEFVNSEKRMPA
jgi:UDP-N-acetylglucosamine transferase subunit ALG13